MDKFEKFKIEHCENCESKEICEGQTITIDGKVKCITRNIVE